MFRFFYWIDCVTLADVGVLRDGGPMDVTNTTVVRVGALALLWGSVFLWIELALEGLTPIQITFARCVLGGLVLLGLSRVQGQRLPRDRAVWGHLVVAAFLCHVLPFALFALGQRSVDSGVAGVLNATTPLWTYAIALTLGSDAVNGIRAGGLVTGFAGTVLIFAPWQAGTPGWGALAIVTAAVSYAVAFTYMGRFLTGRGVAPTALSATQLLVAAALTAVALPVDGMPSHVSLTAVTAVVILGVFGTGVTLALFYRLVADEGATRAAAVTYLLPVVAVALGWLVLDERLTARIITGMAIVLVGVGLTRRQEPSSRPQRTAVQASGSESQ